MTSQTCEIGVVRELFDRCTTGESQAWRELYGTYYPKVCRFLTHLGVRPEELEDACQEVFVQVFRYLARFEYRADFLTWLPYCSPLAATAHGLASLTPNFCFSFPASSRPSISRAALSALSSPIPASVTVAVTSAITSPVHASQTRKVPRASGDRRPTRGSPKGWAARLTLVTSP